MNHNTGRYTVGVICALLPLISAAADFSLSHQTINFATNHPSVAPAPQFVTATISGNVSGTLYILTRVEGPAVASISNVRISGSSGSATVRPAWPSNLGPGTYSSTITVTACVNDASCTTGQLTGSPRTIDVTYAIQGAVQGDVVAPRVVAAGVAGEVILRGRGFSSVSEVSFGGTAATEFEVVSDDEIHATYPALNVGSHPLALNTGAVVFSGSLAVVAAPGFVAQTLSYPSAPQEISALQYDAEREVLFLGARYAQSANNQILRYPFAGGTGGTPQSISIPAFRDMSLSPDGTKLLAVADSALTEVDASTLALSTPRSTGGPLGSLEYLKNIAVANDGYALVTTGYTGSGNTFAYVYSTSTGSFQMLYDTTKAFSYATPAVGPDGSRLVLFQQNSHLTYQYDASSQLTSITSLGFRRAALVTPALGRAATRIAVTGVVSDGLTNGSLTTNVYDSSYHLLGKLPSTTTAVVIRPDGTRAYTFDSAGLLRSFDLTASVSGGAFPQVGTGLSIPNPSTGSSPVRIAISPDGGTLFLAGNARIVIQPSPP